MTITAANPLEEFQWTPQPKAEALVRGLVAEFLGRNRFAADLAKRMKEETGTRFYDWVEAIVLPRSTTTEQKLRSVGYEKKTDDIWVNPNGMFPRVRMHDTPVAAVHLKVDSVADFADVWRLQSGIEGEPLAPYRRVRA